jgi:CPA2 family monovalent cation:H+ antiporter-2
MHEDIKLTEIAIVVVAALAGGLGLARLGQPAILGYILSGIILGPSGFALINSRDQVSVLAELGVLLLLFVVGMELSLRTFKKVWGIATLCTLLQILISITITVTLSNMFGWSMGLSLLLGFVASVSSTAVVVKMMESLGELKTETGQLTIGILIAQDLAIVPMILILRNYGESWFSPMLFFKVIASIGVIAILIGYLSRRQRVRLPLTQMIAGEKDLAPLASMTFCFAAAAISGLIGLSAPYGAFLAGLILGNTHERGVMLETIKPVQSILMMAFFLSIGLLLDVDFIWQHLSTVLLLLFVITIGKTALNIGILRVLHLPWSQAFLVGVVLAQLGEFAFLMASISNETHIINEFGERLIIGLTVLSLAFSPIWLACAKRLRAFADVNSIPLKGIVDMIYGEKLSFFKRTMRRTKTYILKKIARVQKVLPKSDDSTESPKVSKDDDSRAEF